MKKIYNVGDEVSFKIDDEILSGSVYIVDALGTFENPGVTSYDILVKKKNNEILYKHIPEDILLSDEYEIGDYVSFKYNEEVLEDYIDGFNNDIYSINGKFIPKRDIIEKLKEPKYILTLKGILYGALINHINKKQILDNVISEILDGINKSDYLILHKSEVKYQENDN